jgi:hypothetical protein
VVRTDPQAAGLQRVLKGSGASRRRLIFEVPDENCVAERSHRLWLVPDSYTAKFADV